MTKVSFFLVLSSYFWGVKQLLAIPLILVMLVKPLWPITEYIINYDYIVINLCENRDRPQLQCDGKCYLAKMFAEKSKDDHKNPFAEGQMHEIPLILNSDTTLAINDVSDTLHQSQIANDSYSNLHTFLYVFEIIQPPEV